MANGVVLSATGNKDSVGYAFSSEVTSTGKGNVLIKWRADFGTKYLDFVSEATVKASSLFFVHISFLSKKPSVHLVTDSLPRVDECHKMSCIFIRNVQTFVCARSLGVTFLKLSFKVKKGPYGFGRAPSSPQKALSKSKDPFFIAN